MALGYDYIKTGEFTYRLVHKDTKEPFNLGKAICEKYDRGDFADKKLKI